MTGPIHIPDRETLSQHIDAAFTYTCGDRIRHIFVSPLKLLVGMEMEVNELFLVLYDAAAEFGPSTEVNAEWEKLPPLIDQFLENIGAPESTRREMAVLFRLTGIGDFEDCSMLTP